MIFWSFVAGVVTFYCSLGPDSLLPNILYTIKYKPKVSTRSSARLRQCAWMAIRVQSYF